MLASAWQDPFVVVFTNGSKWAAKRIIPHGHQIKTARPCGRMAAKFAVFAAIIKATGGT